MIRSIRSRLTALAAALALLAAGLAADRALQAGRHAGEATRAAAANAATDDLLAAATAWAVERGTANGLLADPKAASAAQRETLAEARRQGDAAFARGLAGARALGGAGIAEAAAAAEQRLARANDLRSQVDRAFAAAEPADAALRAAWFPAMSDLVVAAGQGLFEAAQDAMGRTESQVLQGFSLKHALWAAAEYAGRERGTINAILAAGRAMGANDLHALGETRGRVAAAWTTAAALADGFGPTAAAAVARARSEYFDGSFQALRLAVLRAGDPAVALPAGGQRYPVPAAGSFGAATAAIAPTLAAQRAVTEALAASLADARADRLLDAALSVLALVVTLAIGAVTAVFAVRGVGRPLAAMAQAMERLAAGNLEIAMIGEARRDEVGVLARALRVFRDGAAEQRRLAAAVAVEQAAKQARAAQVDALVQGFEGEAAATLRAVETANATQQIGVQIAAMQGETGRAVATIGGIAKTVAEIGAMTGQIAAAAEEQAVAMQEVGRAVAAAAAGTQEVTRHAAEVTRDATETGAAASQVNAASGELAYQAEALRGRVDAFLVAIRAA